MGVLRFYTTEEVATFCRVTPQGVRKWVKQGKLRAVIRPGSPGHFLFSDLDLLDFQVRHFLAKWEWRKRVRQKKAARLRAAQKPSATTRITTQRTTSSTKNM
jgi:DNA-binding transcriptional MerR regulator